MKKTTSLIPSGYYCYKDVKKVKGKYKLIGICPYWSKRKNKPEQECGYCAYLGKGDWDINKEKRWCDVRFENGKEIRGKLQTAHEIGFPMSILWDMVKECNINEG